jgi:hypothetical protein
MNKEFIPYEQALELKELGFNGYWFGKFYTKPKCKMFGIDEKGRTYPIKNTPKKLYTTGEHCVLNDSNIIIAPLYQQAFRWFREKYELIFHIECDYNSFLGYIDGYIPIYSLYPYSRDCYKTYEEAELACLKKLIQIVKNK